MTAIDHYKPARAGSLALVDERTEASLKYAARSIALLDSRVKNLTVGRYPNDRDATAEEKASLAMALAVTLWQYEIAPTAVNAKLLHLIGDELVPSAQMLVGLMGRDGIRVNLLENTDERAVVRGRNGDSVETITYTIDQARRSGHLDEYVELWDKQLGRKLRYVLSTDGVPNQEPPPEWAKPLIAKGKTKRAEAWFAYRSDMLVNRALRRLSKWFGAASAFGGTFGQAAQYTPGVDIETGELVDHPADDVADEEIDDAEVLDEEPRPRQRQILDDHLAAATDEPAEPVYSDDDPERPFGADE